MRTPSKLSLYGICVVIGLTSFWFFYEQHYIPNYQLRFFISDIYNEEIPASNASISSTLNMERMMYILNGSHACTKSSELSLVVIVNSSPKNSRQRRVLRNSWTKPLSTSNSTSVVFFMGRTADEFTVKNIISENEIHRDVVLVDFEESYRNLSLKSILMLRWVRDFCRNTRFVLKTDDDVFINVYNLMNFVNEDKPDTRSIYGRLARGWPPIRNNDSKWMVTEAEYNGTFYPDFVIGGSYLVGIEAVNDLIDAGVRLPYLFLEDVFVNGICAQKVNVSRVWNKEFINGTELRGNCRFYSVICLFEFYTFDITALHEKASDFSGYETCSKRVPKVF